MLNEPQDAWLHAAKISNSPRLRPWWFSSMRDVLNFKIKKRWNQKKYLTWSEGRLRPRTQQGLLWRWDALAQRLLQTHSYEAQHFVSVRSGWLPRKGLHVNLRNRMIANWLLLSLRTPEATVRWELQHTSNESDEWTPFVLNEHETMLKRKSSGN